MSHLSRDEQVLALDEALSASRRAHLDGCARCRDEVAALAAVVVSLRQAAVPEPSPLFWEHFSARVREAVAGEPPPAAPAWRLPRWGLAFSGATIVVAVVAVVFALLEPGRNEHGAADRSRVQAAATSSPPVPLSDPPAAVDTDEAADERWGVLLAVADGTPLTEEETLAVPSRPGGAEMAAGDLTDEERAALVALLNEAIAAPAGRRAS